MKYRRNTSKCFLLMTATFHGRKILYKNTTHVTYYRKFYVMTKYVQLACVHDPM